MKNFEKAQITVDSVATHAAVTMLADVFRHIVLPGLKTSKDLNNGFYQVERKLLTFDGYKNSQYLFHDADMRKDAWRIFNYLTLNPLDRDAKKMRSINVSSPVCVSESLSQIRRMLLVRSEGNAHNLFGIINRGVHSFSDVIKSAEAFRAAELTTQYALSAEVYFEILRAILVQYPGVVQVQIQSDLKSEFRLIAWGGFKMK